MDNTPKDSISKEIFFSSGNLMLKGILHLPDTDHPPVVIGLHGLLSDKESPKQIELARRCNAAGIAYFRFDHRGCGESQGIFENVTSLGGRSRDLLQAIRILMARRELGKRMGLFGSSFGGTTVLNVAAELNRANQDASQKAGFPAMTIDAMVTAAAPISSQYLKTAPEPSPEWSFLTPEFFHTHLQFDLTDKLEALHHVLLFHGNADKIVPFNNARIIYEGVQTPKELICQENGDHSMRNPAHQADFQEKALEWFKTYLF